MWKWSLAAGVAALLMTPSLGSAQSALDKLVEAAKKERELTFVASGATFGGAETMAKLEAAFNKKFGTNMKLRFTPGPNMLAMAARVAQEHKAGAKSTTDLYIGPPSSYSFLTKEDALTEVKWSETFPWITPEMEISKNRGVLVLTSISAILYNPKLLKPADAPKSNEDLVDPAKSKNWAGKMAVPPYPDWIIELSLIWPKDKVLDFARKVTSQAAGFIRYQEGQRLLSGEFAIMANEGDGPSAKAFWAAKGAQVEFVVGTDPAFAFFFQVSVPKGAASPNLAILFAGFLASPEAQAIIDANGFQGSHLVQGTITQKYIAAHRLNLVKPQQVLDFYEKGGDPELAEQINKMLKR
jgi:ABC-type Fe3+ transport system substrate-binding protein